MPWRRKWQPTPVSLPGKFHGQRSLEATVRGVAKSQTRLSNFPHSEAVVLYGTIGMADLLSLLPALKSNNSQCLGDKDGMCAEKNLASPVTEVRQKCPHGADTMWYFVPFCFPRKPFCRASGWGRWDPKHLAQPPRRTASRRQGEPRRPWLWWRRKCYLCPNPLPWTSKTRSKQQWEARVQEGASEPPVCEQ